MPAVQNSAPLLAATRKEKSGAIIGFSKKRKKALNYPLITQSNSRQHILRQHTTHERPRSLFFYFLSLSCAQTTTTNNVTTHLQQTIDACRRRSDKTHRLLPDSSAKDLTPYALHIINLRNKNAKDRKNYTNRDLEIEKANGIVERKKRKTIGPPHRD